MKHLGKLVLFLILSVNALITGTLLLVAYSPHLHPTTHPVAACLGLAFPLFLFANGCFLFFWLLIQQYRAALLPLLGFVCCYPQLSTYLPIALQEAAPPEGSFKLLSYNIMGFAGHMKQEGHNPILDYLRQSEADVLCLQEYSTSDNTRRHLAQRDVEEALKAYPYRRITTVGDSHNHANRLACYSKFPILRAETVKYASHYNGSVAYELLVGEDTLLVVNNHLESNKLTMKDKVVYEDMLKSPQKEKMKSGIRQLVKKLAEASALRAPQADSIAALIRRSPHRHVVVCGDFNDSPISYTHRTIASGELTDAFVQTGNGLGISYNQHKFYFRIDHILLSKSLKAYNCTVDRSIKESDHYPIWCYIAKK